MENISWLNSLKDAIESLPDGKCEAMDQIRMLVGISVEDFETLLRLLDKSNYSRVVFEVSNTEVELGKALGYPLEVNVKIVTAQGEVSLRFLFKASRWNTTNNVQGEFSP